MLSETTIVFPPSKIKCTVKKKKRKKSSLHGVHTLISNANIALFVMLLLLLYYFTIFTEIFHQPETVVGNPACHLLLHNLPAKYLDTSTTGSAVYGFSFLIVHLHISVFYAIPSRYVSTYAKIMTVFRDVWLEIKKIQRYCIEIEANIHVRV